MDPSKPETCFELNFIEPSYLLGLGIILSLEGMEMEQEREQNKT